MQSKRNSRNTKTRTISIGGNSKLQIFRELQLQSVMMNDYAKELFDSDRFIISSEKYSLNIVELTVRELGFPQGARMKEIINKANSNGLDYCPLELGPYLRLAYQKQHEGNSVSQSEFNQAPYGSITIVSKPLNDDDFPKGFYLRKIDGVLWLRGYIADDEHLWNPSDHLIFKV